MSLDQSPAELEAPRSATANFTAAPATQSQISSSTPQVEYDSAADAYDSGDDAYQYRALSTPAVAALVLGLLSPLALFDWLLGLIPLSAIVLGVVALRKIRSQPDEFTGSALALGGTVLAALFWIGGFTRLGYIYATEVPAGYARVDYSTLQPLPGDPPDRVPPDANALDGKKIFIKGYVYPGQRQSGITRFLLVRDQGTCCFGGNPKVTDRIVVELSDPKGFAFSSKLYKVAGEFHVTQPDQAPDAKGAVFYRLENAQLR